VQEILRPPTVDEIEELEFMRIALEQGVLTRFFGPGAIPEDGLFVEMLRELGVDRDLSQCSILDVRDLVLPGRGGASDLDLVAELRERRVARGLGLAQATAEHMDAIPRDLPSLLAVLDDIEASRERLREVVRRRLEKKAELRRLLGRWRTRWLFRRKRIFEVRDEILELDAVCEDQSRVTAAHADVPDEPVSRGLDARMKAVLFGQLATVFSAYVGCMKLPERQRREQLQEFIGKVQASGTVQGTRNGR
jgi:hypothetical protein